MYEHLSPTNVEMLNACKFRDLNFFQFEDSILVFACDSSGSVGSLEKDHFHRTPYQSGIQIVKVPLTELLSCGAQPIAIYADFCYKDSEYNNEVCQGILDELSSIGADPSMLFKAYGTYSTPQYSSIGLTAIGIAPKGSLRINTSIHGDIICAVGLPVNKDYFSLQISTSIVKKLAALDYVHEILPCGSKGIRYEANTLAKTNGLTFIEYMNSPLTDQATFSCGASAVVLISMRKDDYPKLCNINLPIEINQFGELVGEKSANDFSDCGSTDFYKLLDNGRICLENGWSIHSTGALSFARGEQKEDWVGYSQIGELTQELVVSALTNLIRNGFKPFLIVNNLNFSMKSGGVESISAIQNLMENYEMVPSTQLTGSTEDNHFAGQTGCAVRVFGTKRNDTPEFERNDEKHF